MFFTKLVTTHGHLNIKSTVVISQRDTDRQTERERGVLFNKAVKCQIYILPMVSALKYEAGALVE